MKQLNKIIKIALGSTISILLANMLGLQYSISAGIITLLTIQDTKKETIQISLKRVVAFIIAVILASLLFLNLGYHTITFGVFLFLFVGVCSFCKLGDGISMNAVLTTHYVLSQSIAPNMIVNEALLLLIGAGIGTLINLFMPSNLTSIRAEQEIIEADLRKIFFRMGYFLQESDKSSYEGTCFSPLEEHINQGLSHAYTNMNNTLLKESQYYIRYMEMRKQQLQVLREIYEKIKSLHEVPIQTNEVIAFIEQIANTLSESNNAKSLLLLEHTIQENFKLSPLPTSRGEFEDRAILFMILKDLRMFLLIKERFSDTLTKDQIAMYWS